MQFIFGGAAAASCSAAPKAVAPVISDVTLAIAAGAGSVAAPLFTGVSGDPAPYGGFVTKTMGCDSVTLVVSYLDGDDCDSCTVDTLTTVDVTLTIPANASGVQLPAGYITAITAQVVDSAGTPVNSTIGGDVRFTSSRAGACGADVLVP